MATAVAFPLQAEQNAGAPDRTEAGVRVSVTVEVVDENRVEVPDAQVSAAQVGRVVRCVTDFAGHCGLALAPGTYSVESRKPGFYVATAQVDSNLTDRVEVTMPHQQEVKETVSVSAAPPGIDPQQTSANESFSGNDIVNIPYPSTRDVRNILTFLPGVVAGNSEQIHIAGAHTYDNEDLLDGFNITDPVSGLLNLRVNADAVRGIVAEQSRYPVEYGKGSGGVLGLETGMGDDHMRFSATNFLPSFESRDGANLDKFVPRAIVSGPIRAGKAWFMEAPEGEYDTNILRGLPRGADSAPLTRASNLVKAQVNLDAADILSGSFLFNWLDQEHAGLSALNPVPATPNQKQSAYFSDLKEQHAFDNGGLGEAGFGWLSVDGSEHPLGLQPLEVNPEGNTGNYFKTDTSRASRAEGTATFYFPILQGAGAHQLKFGVDADRVSYFQRDERSPILVFAENGAQVEQLVFAPSNVFQKTKFAAGAYLEDRWSPNKRFLLEPGLRVDWDGLLQREWVSPRLAATYGLSGNTKVSLGAGLFYDETNLEFLTRPLQGERIEEFFNGPSQILISSRTITYSVPPSLQEPHAANFSAGLDHLFPKGVLVRSDFIERRGSNGFTFLNPALSYPTFGNVNLTLRNGASEHYRALQLSARHAVRGDYFVLLSYVRSVAKSSVVPDMTVDQIPNVLSAAQWSGPLPWDAPNRVLSYGWLPLVKGFDFAYTLEWHTGFPFSVVDQRQSVVGNVDSTRFPAYFDLAPYVEKRFALAGINWALRGGFDNITGARDPAVVDNNVNSANFLVFSQDKGRTFTARIRLIGRK